LDGNDGRIKDTLERIEYRASMHAGKNFLNKNGEMKDKRQRTCGNVNEAERGETERFPAIHPRASGNYFLRLLE